MSRYDRRRFFDSLCDLRTRYTDLGLDDTTSVISVEDMIAEAERLLVAPATNDATTPPTQTSDRSA